MAQPVGHIGESFGFGKLGGEELSLGLIVNTLSLTAFSIASMMVTFYFIIAAFELITSQGDKAHIVSARSKIYHSLIGFMILIALFFVMQYLLPALGVENLKVFS
jgi:hypothetical protein